MRVRHLQTYLQSQRLLCTGRTESLRGLALGLDAASWTRGLLELKDPFAELMGGLPLCVDAAIDRQLTRFAEHEIFPYFFFQGVSPNGHSLFTKIDSRAISEAWVLLMEKNTSQAHAKLGRIASRLTAELVCYLARYLRARAFVAEPAGRNERAPRPVKVQRRLAVFQCPYLCSSQIAHFVRNHVLDAVYGITSFLLVGLPRVITNIDFEKGKFDWVEKDQLLRAWDVTEQQLADACILAGTEYCHTLPHVNILSPKSFSFETALSLAKSGTLNQYLQFFPHEPVRQEFRHLYSLSRAVLYVLIAMQGNGTVAALPPGPPMPAEGLPHAPHQTEHDSGKDIAAGDAIRRIEHKCANTTTLSPVPHDLRVVKGWRLPNAVFLLMLEGILSPDLVKALAYGVWRDFDTPIVLPEQYETLLIQCRHYRLLALGMIARHLHPSFLQRRITFEFVSRKSDDPLVLLSNANNNTESQYAPEIRPILPWCFDIRDTEHQLQGRNLDIPTMLFCLDWHLLSMKRHYSEEFASLSIEGNYAGGPILNGDKLRVVDLTCTDVAHSERLARKVLALRNRRRRLAPSQNYGITLVIMTFLEALDYFDATSSPPGAPTALGYLLRTYSTQEFEEEMVVAVELLKLGLLSGSEFTYGKENDYPPALVSPVPAPFMDVANKAAIVTRKWYMRIPVGTLELQRIQQSIRLITRALSLTPITLKPEVTSCPGHFLDFDVAAFQALVKQVRRSLNYLLEGCMANLALEKPIYGRLFTAEIFDPRAPKILWFRPVLGVGGVIIKHILMLSGRPGEDAATVHATLPEKFPEVADFWGSVLRMCEFWSQLSRIVRAWGYDGTDEISGSFARADVLLCLQMWDLLPHLNNGKLPQQYPAFCELIEKSLGTDLGSAISKRGRHNGGSAGNSAGPVSDQMPQSSNTVTVG